MSKPPTLARMPRTSAGSSPRVASSTMRIFLARPSPLRPPPRPTTSAPDLAAERGQYAGAGGGVADAHFTHAKDIVTASFDRFDSLHTGPDRAEPRPSVHGRLLGEILVPSAMRRLTIFWVSPVWQQTSAQTCSVISGAYSASGSAF